MKEILFEWNPWWSKEYHFEGIYREKAKEVYPWINRREIISIVGVRRSGKTTLFFELIGYLINKKKVSPNRILFIKADDDRIDANNLIDLALEEYRRWITPSEKMFVFIDEVQEIKNWEKTLKRIYDLNKDIKIFISGSNASILKSELSSALAGRCAYFEMFPFDFSEFLKAHDTKIEKEFDIFKNRNKIRHLLPKYINYGSFPEVVLEKNEKLKNELVGFYFDSIFYKDVIKRKSIRNPAKMEKLVKYLMQNISNPMNFTKIAKILDLTTDSVVEYVKCLEDAYLVFQVNIFEFSYKKQIINPKKVYCIDTGIRNVVSFNFSQDSGRLYENIVFISLRRKYGEIFYWKGKGECDFIAKDGKKLEAIQVCYDIANAKEREVAGLVEALNALKLKQGLILTQDYEGTERHSSKEIIFMPLWRWLITRL